MSRFPSFADSPAQRVGGSLALDFVNTVELRGDPAARGERLTDYGELGHWLAQAGLLDRIELRALLAEAARRPRDAARVLDEARALREAIARLADGGGRGRRADLARLNRALGPAARLVAAGPGFVWEGEGDALAAPLAAVAREAAALLASDRHGRVRHCADPRCGWLFLDSGRGPGRRWCSMAGCGNRAKARRHHRRKGAVRPARP
ncbi:MAG: ABATE domain-containing protein [Alphaproteobacteria bacterium]